MLKSCPFCRGEARKVRNWNEGSEQITGVCCMNRNCGAFYAHIPFDAWQTRTPATPKGLDREKLERLIKDCIRSDGWRSDVITDAIISNQDDLTGEL